MKNKKESLYQKIAVVNGKEITAKYVKTLDYDEREALVEPLFQHFRAQGWLYPDDHAKVKSEYKKLCELKMDLSTNELFNNSSLATNICKYYCHKFYDATEVKYKTMKEVFNNDDDLRYLIRNRLGFDWWDKEDNDETFNICFRMLVQGMRSSRLVPSISVFKPNIAKYLYMKYSQDGDTVFDYSAGWGGRMLGAASCGRKYIGVDPWTTDELEAMKSELSLENITLINDGSEHVRLEENSVDFSFSSPPYYSQEVYSSDERQAYNKGEDYFYNVYWKNTLENVKHMLKPGKWFGLNVKNYPKMVEMAEEVFGPVVEEVYLRTVRSHLNKTAGITKHESVYMFKNEK
jgi:DNA modification methylase